jgi:Tol biopolymer transport system component
MTAARRVLLSVLAVAVAMSMAQMAGAVPPKTRLVSKTTGGVAGIGDSEASVLSANGRYVVFQSYATNFPKSGGATPRLYLVDHTTGKIWLVGKNSSGVPANTGSRQATISGSGRYIAFLSSASNLPQGDGVKSQVYVHDRVTGTTRLVSKTTGGVASDTGSGGPSISQNGRYVAFNSDGDNLPRGDGAYVQVYVHDRSTGRTRVISTANDNPDGNSQSPSISGNGRIVAFESRSTHLTQGDGTALMYYWDRRTGDIELASATTSGLAASGASADAIVAGNGRVITFWSASANLPGGDGVLDQVYAHDLGTGTTRLISKTSGGVAGTDDSTEAEISFDGHYVVFKSQAANFPAGDGTRVHVYIHDRREGTTRLLSKNSKQKAGNANSFTPFISADGRYASFESYATNLPGGGNSMLQVYVRGPLI